ncbi:hypothetical protein [Lysobacter humi (ex Lee et al. 2017)]
MHRPSEIARVRRRLERDSLPRLQMSAIVLLTAAVGLLASWMLHAAGMDAMWLRYPLAAALAYVAFLVQLRLWLAWRDEPGSLVDALPSGSGSGGGGGSGTGAWSGAGGRSGGGGASAGWDAGTLDAASSGGMLDGIDLPGDEAAIPVLAAVVAAVVVLGGVIAMAWIVWSAPVLMAELVVDAAIAGGLYRRLRRIEAEGWWRVALRRTIAPFAAVAVGALLLGGVLHVVAPGASTLGEVGAARASR